MSEFETNPNSLLFMMATLSPKVAESLEREDYRIAVYQDDADLDHVLENAFSNLIQDLQTIGLILEVEPYFYLDNHLNLSMFLEVAKYILPNTLYDFVRVDPKIRNLISGIVDGTTGSDMTFIHAYLNELGGLDGNLAILPDLTDFIDQLYPLISQTQVFSDYFKNIIELYQEERPGDITDVERHIAYREIMKEKIGDFSFAVSRFEGYDYYEDLLKIQNLFIRDLLSPENFIEYSYLFLEDKHNLPEELQTNYDRKWYHYEVSHRWCYPFFLIRNITPSVAEQVAIACYAYMDNGTNEGAYHRQMADFRKAYPDLHKIDDRIFKANPEITYG